MTLARTIPAAEVACRNLKKRKKYIFSEKNDPKEDRINIMKKLIAIGRLPNLSDNGPAIKLTIAAPIENADTLS